MTQDLPHNHAQFRLGRDRLARAMRLLLARNELSHHELEQLVDWATDDEDARGWISKSQVSSLRNARLPKPGPQIFVALGALNEALARLHHEPPTRPLPPTLRRIAVDPGPWFLERPGTGEPCDAGDWFRIYCALQHHPELEDLPEVFSDRDAALASEHLALLGQRWMLEQRLTIAEAKREIERLSPQLWQVVLGEHRMDAKELADERDALRFLVGRLQGSDALSVRDLDRWIRTG